MCSADAWGSSRKKRSGHRSARCGADETEAKDAVRGFFGVERRSYQLSPELLIGTMEEAGGLNDAIELAEKARKKVGL